MTQPSGRFYSRSSGDGDRPANWIELRTLDGDFVGAFLSVLMVQDYVERRPGREYRAISWLTGRVEGRFLVAGMWSRRVRWRKDPKA